MTYFDQTAFDKNLLLTQQYCQLQLANTQKSTAAIFRSFNPVYKMQPLFRFSMPENKIEIFEWHIDLLGKSETIDDLFHQQLQYKKEVGNPENVIFFEGAIIIVEIDYTVADGASEGGSYGFFDSYDVRLLIRGFI